MMTQLKRRETTPNTSSLRTRACSSRTDSRIVVPVLSVAVEMIGIAGND
jgi:hypothetical protein